jgi:predicted phage tail protein
MIAVLGIKRVIVLLFLAAACALLGAAVYMYLIPEVAAKQREFRSVQGQVSTLRGDINRMQVEFEQLEDQKEEFEALAADGFFKDQSRRQAELILNKIQKTSGVSKAIASIDSGIIEDNEEAKKAEHKILKSPISVKLEAFDDINVFHYLFLVERYFPGHVTIERVYLERKADVTGTVLRAIATGSNPALVEADVSMMWRTMIPESSVIGGEQK